MTRTTAILALADGRYYPGVSFGAEGEAVGEVVFNTSMTGYQEILTDPSYEGQLVAMTYPQIGNVGIEGIDTRSLVRLLRDHGSQEAIISTLDSDPNDLVAKAKASPGLIGRDLVRNVTCAEPYDWNQGMWDLRGGYKRREITAGSKKSRRKKTGSFRAPVFSVVAYDYGIKFNILRNLAEAGCRVKVVPAATSAEDVLALNPDGIFLSNGPGDPDAVPYAKANVQKLIGKKPIFGICLGHQIMGLALGGKTYKLKFGHHGGNQPVMDLTTKKVEITAQNHGFAVDADSLKGAVEVTHLNLNDNTVEGLAHRELPIFSVQYHPESSPGPHDANYLFRRFMDLMASHRG